MLPPISNLVYNDLSEASRFCERQQINNFIQQINDFIILEVAVDIDLFSNTTSNK